MFKLLKGLKKYLLQTITAPLFKLLEVCFELIVPLVTASIIDNGIGSGDKGYILKMCGLLCLLAAVGLVCTLIAQYFAAKASVNFTCDLRSRLYRHISSFSYKTIDKIGVSTLITRLTADLNQVQTGINLTLRLLLRSPFVVFGAMIMAFSVAGSAAMIFVVIIPILAAVVFAVMLITIPMYKRVQSQLDGVLGKTVEALKGVRVIRAFCREEKEAEDFSEKNSFLMKNQLVVGRISSLLTPATVVIINIGIAVLIYKGALKVEAGGLTSGQVVALYNYMSQILIELIKLANLIINITKSIACGNRVEALLEIPVEDNEGILNGKEKFENIIEFKNVSLKYNNSSEWVLKNISFSIKKGETLGIIGGTGSGKSSLVNLIPRFYKPQEGKILIKDIDINNFSPKALRCKIGIVAQKSILFKGTLRENMKHSNPKANDTLILKALKIAQAENIVNEKPEGLDFIIEQEGKNLSGGQKQRLNIARALVKEPEILILDDSSSALDYATDAALRSALREICGKTTVIIVSQRASALRHADKIIVLEDGNILGIGNDSELYSSCEAYKEIRDTQFMAIDKGVGLNE